MEQSTLGLLRSFWREISPGWRFSLISVTLMRVFYTLWSVFFLFSFPLVVQNQDFFGEPIVTVFDMQSSRAFVYNRLVNGDRLAFKRFDQLHLADTKTGSLWQVIDGKSVSGTHQGQSLSPASISADQVFPYYDVSTFSIPWLAIWQRFDANWYLAIAERGYGSVPGDVHFPPLYPVLIRLVSLVFRNNFVSALLISQISLYILIKLLYDLFAEWGDHELATKSLFFLLIFPTSFFFFSAYTEAPFVIFTLLSLKSIRDQNWRWAGFWIFCAILVRLQGVVLLLPFGWSLLQTGFKGIRMKDLVLAIFSPLAAVGVYLLIRARSGDSSVIPFTETNLHARIVPPWENLIYSFRYIADELATHIDILNLVTFILFGILIVVYWNKFPLVYSLFSIASLVLLSMRLVETQPLNSMIRYVLTIFPVFYLFGVFARHKWLNLFMFACFLSLNLFLSAQFFLWGWVA